MLQASAPLRIDLAGGTLDIWPLYLLLGGGLTVNLAIDRRAEAVLEERDDKRIRLIAEDLGLVEEVPSWEGLTPSGGLRLVKLLVRFYKPRRGFELRTSVAAPPGAGLGGSSALALAVAALLERISRGNRNIVELIGLVRDLEAEALGVPAGVQDHYATAYGGLNAIWLEPGRVRREPLHPSAAFLEELGTRLLLVHTGLVHRSGQLNWEVFRRYVEGDLRARDGLRRGKEAALRMREALMAEDLEGMGEALHAEWEARRELAPGITTPEVDRLIELAWGNGATGAKLCGAGGGGALLLLAREGAKARLEQVLVEEGARPLGFVLALRGLRIERV